MKMQTVSLILFLFLIRYNLLGQNMYSPIPRYDWKEMTTLDSAYLRISYEMIFRDALPYYMSEPNALKGHIFK